MNTTPVAKSKKLSCNRNINNAETSSGLNPSNTSTPVQSKKSSIDTDSDDGPPIYYLSTADTTEDINVAWDWNSPQAIEKKNRKQKRLLLSQSPKLYSKRHASVNQIQNLEKLREELIAFREELALPPEDEDSLCLSPLQEGEFKQNPTNPPIIVDNNQNVDNMDFDDVFNDSINEKLALFSQKIETVLLKKNQGPNNKCDVQQICNIINKVEDDVDNNKVVKKIESHNDFKIIDDSFDLALQAIQDKDIELLSQIKERKATNNISINKATNSITLKRTQSDVQFNRKNSPQSTSRNLEFNRTKSFELESGCVLSQKQLEEIERKRLEALARRKKQEKTYDGGNSPIKCSPEKIEQKRLQALAKLEAKRLDIVERKRQEALKRLNRRKNQLQFKNSLTKKL